ncbi:MAG: MMPL family transporter, partial [Gammaproteobacteria bacterium]|nr:MMPL family transporter [Gammaproteobacteria bacterium]
NYRTLEAPDIDKQQALQELTTSELYAELLASRDGNTTALQINIDDYPLYRELLEKRGPLLKKKRSSGLTAEEELELAQVRRDFAAEKRRLSAQNKRQVAEIRAIMARFSDRGTLHLGGIPMIQDDMITFIRNDLKTFGAGISLFLVLMLTAIFRHVRWVVLPLLSCAYAGTLMIGLLGLAGWQVTVISSNFISLMLIITMSMNVHLTVRYRELHTADESLSHRELIRRTTRGLVWPCLYTVLTTIIGFLSLVVSGIKPVIDFGWMMTVGLIVVFFTSFTLFPALLGLLDKQPGRLDETRRSAPTALLARLTLRAGNAVIIAAVLILAAALYGVTRLEVENSFVSYFSERTEIYQGLKLIDQELGGTTPVDIILSFPPEEVLTEFDDEELDIFGEIESDKSDAWFTADKIERIEAVHDYLDGIDTVGKVISLATVLRIAEKLTPGIKLDTFELGVIYKRLPETLKEAMLDPYISIDHDEARISVRVVDSRSDLRRDALLKQINRDLEDKLGIPRDEFQVTGMLVLYNNVLQSLFRSQILTLGMVMLGIFVMLLLLFRSLKLATITIIPNVLAALAILGLMGLLGLPLDLMTITIAAISIGIAVDNCIHYVYRFRDALPRFGDYEQTLVFCHNNIGRAMFYTSITIVVGFSILVLSNFIPSIYFGLLTALAMVLALLGALTLLPRLIMLVRPFPLPVTPGA